MKYTFKEFEAMAKEIKVSGHTLYQPFDGVSAAIMTHTLRNGITLVEVGTINDKGQMIKDLSIEICRSHEFVRLTNERVGWKSATMATTPKSIFVTDNANQIPSWVNHIGVSSKVYKFLLDMVKNYDPAKLVVSAKEEPEMKPFDERPMTFGEFIEFCRSVKNRRDAYGVYKPFGNLNLALHIYDTGCQVNFARIDETGFPMARMVFLFGEDYVKVCRVLPNGATNYESGVEYALTDPFCFSTKDVAVNWWKRAGLNGSEYEFFRDMLGEFYSSLCA